MRIIRCLAVSIAAIVISQPFVYPAIETRVNGSDVFDSVVLAQAAFATLVSLVPLGIELAGFRNTVVSWIVLVFSTIPTVLALYPLSQAFFGYIPVQPR